MGYAVQTAIVALNEFAASILHDFSVRREGGTRCPDEHRPRRSDALVVDELAQDLDGLDE